MKDYASKFINLIKNSNLKDYYAGAGLTRLQVDSFVSKVAFIYEKIRNAIDYKEEHLLRKSAIQRIVWRKLNLNLSQILDTNNIANSLIKELIRAGYLENNLIPVSKIDEVKEIIDRYLELAELAKIKKLTPEGNKMFRWLISLAACEIEEKLVPPIQHFALVNYTFQILAREIKLADDKLSEEEKKLQIIIAINRTLVKSDAAMINFLIWRFYCPDWPAVSQEQLTLIAKKLYHLKTAIDKQAKYYLGEKLVRLFKKYSVVFHVLKEIILEKPTEVERIFDQPEELEANIKKTCDRMYKKARTKLRRSIFRVTLYIFITKMLLVLLLELPYERYISHSLDYLPLFINALFFPFLMFLIGMIIRVPSKKNTELIVKVAKDIVFNARIGGVVGISSTVKRNPITSFIFWVFYIVLLAVCFGAIVYILTKLSFTVFSIFIFALFLSLISFFGITIRQGVRELVIVEKKEGLFTFLLNLLSLPFLRMGYWFSVKFSKFNVFVFIFDFIIEAPFKVFLDVVEDWFGYLKEKKEEIYNQRNN